ncbi:MAG: hypothetical protein ABR585_09470 [Gemmatimonadaceae bacterium]
MTTESVVRRSIVGLATGAILLLPSANGALTAQSFPATPRPIVYAYDDIPRDDSRPVKPGTSLALRARQIDATQPPTVIRAKDAVAALVPRQMPALTQPFVIGLLGASLMLLAFSTGGVGPKRVALRMAPLLLFGLTSFHPLKASGAPPPSKASHRSARATRTPLAVRVVQAPDPVVVPDPVMIPDYRVMTDDDQMRMARKMRDWSQRQERLMARRLYRSRIWQEARDQRLREQICAIMREQTESDIC